MEILPVKIVRQILHIPAPLPYCVQVEITNVCNLSCGMCPRHHVAVSRMHMKLPLFKKIIDRLDGVREVTLVGLGEPFMHPDIFEAIDYCKKQALKVKITTNGLLLNDDKKLISVIHSGLDSISFSVEGGVTGNSVENTHQNDSVFAIIPRLISLKKMLKKGPVITAQTIMVGGHEEELFSLIEWCAEHDVDRVNVQRMTKYFETGLERPDESAEKKIFFKLAQLRKKYGIRIDCLQDQFFTGSLGWLYRNCKKMLRMDGSCIRLRDYPYITLSADMTPCCVLPDQKFGNLLTSDLATVWHGQQLKEFRKNHQSHKICSKCDNLRLCQVV